MCRLALLLCALAAALTTAHPTHPVCMGCVHAAPQCRRRRRTKLGSRWAVLSLLLYSDSVARMLPGRTTRLVKRALRALS
jgi:hypothetical protein